MKAFWFKRIWPVCFVKRLVPVGLFHFVSFRFVSVLVFLLFLFCSVIVVLALVYALLVLALVYALLTLALFMHYSYDSIQAHTQRHATLKNGYKSKDYNDELMRTFCLLCTCTNA